MQKKVETRHADERSTLIQLERLIQSVTICLLVVARAQNPKLLAIDDLGAHRPNDRKLYLF
jgi:hypothetical protein